MRWRSHKNVKNGEKKTKPNFKFIIMKQTYILKVWHTIVVYQGSHIYGVYQWKMIAQWCVKFVTPFFLTTFGCYLFFLLFVHRMYPSKMSTFTPLLLFVSYTIWTKKLIELYMCITYDNSAAIDKSLIVQKNNEAFHYRLHLCLSFFCAVIFDVGIQVLVFFIFHFLLDFWSVLLPSSTFPWIALKWTF